MKKKHTKGQVVAFLSQKQAMRRLQLNLPNFRRLCILKGIYPVERGAEKSVHKHKGIYIQAEIDGIPVVWIIPHASVTHTPTDVDYRILATCLEFDATLVGSLMCHLYRINNLVYPPKLAVRVEHDPNGYYCGQKESLFEFMSSLSFPLKRSEPAGEVTDDDMTELQAIDEQVSKAISKQLEVQNVKKLFKNKRFFLMREVPREVICLIIRSCGGECSWDKIVSPGYTFQEDDPTIDYQVVDRPLTDMKLTRYYVQPQWVFDCLNAGRLLPTQDYLPGCSLPPHLSPFVGSSGTDEALNTAINSLTTRGGLTEADYLAGLVSLAEIRGARVQAQSEDTTEKDSVMKEILDDSAKKESQLKTDEHAKERRKLKKVTRGMQPKVTPGRTESEAAKQFKEKEEANAERKLRELMLPKKHKNVYKKMVHSIKRKEKEVRQLTAKRRQIDAYFICVLAFWAVVYSLQLH
ncbi:unnamed protein product [Heterobilharzia americana]|nr:unnamed protein product [Heterobilharzia americana]